MWGFKQKQFYVSLLSQSPLVVSSSFTPHLKLVGAGSSSTTLVALAYSQC